MTEHDRLVWILQALSLEANDQIDLFPEFVNAADELAIKWEDLILNENYLSTLDNNIIVDIKNIDKLIEDISGENNLKYWSNNSLLSDNEWERIRVCAKTVLEKLKIRLEKPKKSSDIFFRS